MILEYDQKGSFQGRLDGKTAVLKNEYWIMNEYSNNTKVWNCLF